MIKKKFILEHGKEYIVQDHSLDKTIRGRFKGHMVKHNLLHYCFEHHEDLITVPAETANVMACLVPGLKMIE